MHNYHRYIPYILIIIATSLYIFTLDTGLRTDELMGGDLITHQYAQVQGRPSNAPGYPLYTMLGWVWFRVGRLFLSWLFNPIQILSFYSTLWGLASLWILYHLLMRPEVTNKNWGIAILLTSFYGVTYFFGIIASPPNNTLLPFSKPCSLYGLPLNGNKTPQIKSCS